MANSTDVTLFYFPGSYYSRRVLLALYEKQIAFIDRKINILLGIQNEDWYLSMNPKGEIPVLKHGNVIVCDSTDILEYIEDNIPTDKRLLPPRDTQVGKDVMAFCKYLNTIVIDVITYGIWTHPERSPEGLNLLLRLLAKPKETVHRLSSLAAELRQKAEKNDKFKDYFLSKSQHWDTFVAQIDDTETVTRHLDGLETVFKRADALLAKSKSDAVSKSIETWLFGESFTLADVYMVALIDRLNFLGISCRYFNVEKNPNVLRFWKQARTRPSFRKLIKESRWSFMSLVAPKILKSTASVLMGIAVVGVAVGIFVALGRT
ncbi:hypothetical protein ScPMuIL_000318 [Solemya velum]